MFTLAAFLLTSFILAQQPRQRVISADVPALTPPMPGQSLEASQANYSSVEQLLVARIAGALTRNDMAALEQHSAALDKIARARYLMASSKVMEPISGVLTAFEPQLAALPAFIKEYAEISAKKELPSVLAEALVQFVRAGNAQAAQLAVGDLVLAIDGYEKAVAETDYTKSAAEIKAKQDELTRKYWSEKKGKK